MNTIELKELLHSMSMQEKIGQLVQLSGDFFGTDEVSTGPAAKLGIEDWVSTHAGSVLNVMGAKKVLDIQKRHMEKSRIPLLFMADIVYGYKTVYPMPLALACGWDPDMVETCFRYTAKEAVPDGAHVTFAPMVDVSRDARWGRGMESPGEDPYINGLFAKAAVKGFQGKQDESEPWMAACVKHFAGYGAVEAGREYNTVDMSRWRMTQEYLPPYKAAIEAGAKMVMTSFNTIEGIPATANQWLMKDILRDTWGFDGVLITDYAAIQELIAHGVAQDDKEAAYLAMEAGVDIDMKTPCYANELIPLMEEGKLSQEKIDEAVFRILSLKNDLGLFEDPYKGISEEKAKEEANASTHRDYARYAATQSMVLLKNNQVLPLKKETKIALIGPYADSKDLTGLWAVYGDKSKVVTLKTAFEEVFEHVQTEIGCDYLEDTSTLGDFGMIMNINSGVQGTKEENLKKAIELAKWADVVVFALGEHVLQSGESGSRTDLTLPENQVEFMKQILPYTKKSVVLLFNGHPLVVTNWIDEVDAVMECWYPGSEGPHAIVDILVGNVNPSGRLTVSLPYTVGQCPIYYAAFNTGRPMATSIHSGRFVSRYLDCPNEPLFGFGYGLSYHTCSYGNIELSTNTFTKDERILAKIKIENTSDVKGEEVVQLYLRDIAASVVRPVKELKDFKKVELNPHETKEIVFEIKPEMCAFMNQRLETVIEPGEFEVYIGPNATTLNKAIFRYK